MTNEVWWVCHICGTAVQKVGRGGGKLHPKEGHRKICPDAGYSIEQVPQKSR